MSLIKNFKGMRYPDEYIIRMFYKEGLNHFEAGRVIELGCGSGNNLLHFASYGWECTGVDFDSVMLNYANDNFQTSGFKVKLIESNLGSGLPNIDGLYDVVLIPSSLYYLTRESAVKIISEVRNILSANGLIYLRMRLPDDHRNGRGRQEGRNAYRLTCDYTGEAGLLNIFWEEFELFSLLRNILDIKPESITKLNVAYENIQKGILVRNSDIVIWGRT